MTLTPSSISWLRAATSPLALALTATRGRYRPAPHLRLLNGRLLDLARRRLRGLAVFMPPRHAKSTTCSHYFPSWYLGGWPEHRAIVTTYNASFAASWGRKVRDTLGEFGPLVFGV